MSKKMLIDASHPEETRVAVMSGGKVEDFDFESLSRKPLRGNIYLARITRVEPSLQAAFVEYGGNRHGFLAFNEIHPDYYQIPVSDREILRKAEALEVELAEALAALAGDDEDDDEPDLDEEDDGMRPVPDAVAEDAADRDEVTDDEDEDEEEEPRAAEAGGAEEEEEEEERARERPKGDQPEEQAPEHAPEQAPEQAEAATPETQTPMPADYAGEETAEDAGWHAIEEEEIASLPAIEAERAAGETSDAEAADRDAAGGDVSGGDTADAEAPAAEALRSEEAALSAKADTRAADDGGPEKADADHAEAEETDTEGGPDAGGDAEAESQGRPRRRRGGRRRRKPAEGADDSGASDDEDENGNKARAGEAAGRRPDDAASRDGENDDREESDAPPRRRSRAKSDDPRAAEIAELERRYEAAKRERARLLRNYRIQEVIKRRQIMLVQAVKEERGNKGAALTTYLSLAGRYGVLMPNTARGGGVSRKITNSGDRKRLRKAMAELDIPQGQGLIIRTAGAKRTKAEIKRDYDYLARLWETIRDQTLKSVAPCLIYEEASLIKRAIRDLYDKDTETIQVQGEEGYREAKDFMKMLMPSHAKNVQPYREEVPLFLKFQVEKQLDEMYQPTVKLKSGGYVVIQQTEALVSIDVNSGKATKERNVEATALKTNLEAAAEVARQCRLRDLAGLIVIDFIDMEENKNNRAVEKKLKEAMKHDRARIQLGSISGFGLLELSRQRRRSGIVDGTTRQCPLCEGAGAVRSVEMAALRILRSVEEEALKGKAGVISASAAMDVALYILNQKRDWLNRIEATYGLAVEVLGDAHKNGDQYELSTRGEPTAPQSLRQAGRAERALMDEIDEDGDDAADAEEAPDAPGAVAEREETDEGDERPARRKRRRGGRGARSSDEGSPDDHGGSEAAAKTGRSGAKPDEARDAGGEDEDGQADDAADEDEAGARSPDSDGTSEEDGDKPKKRRRRGRRGGRRNRKGREGEDGETAASGDGTDSAANDAAPVNGSEDGQPPAQAPKEEISAPAQGETGEAEDAATAKASDETPSKDTAGKDGAGSDGAGGGGAGGDGADHEESEDAAAAPAAAVERKAEPEMSEEPERPEEPQGPKRGGWWQRALGR